MTLHATSYALDRSTDNLTLVDYYNERFVIGRFVKIGGKFAVATVGSVQTGVLCIIFRTGGIVNVVEITENIHGCYWSFRDWKEKTIHDFIVGKSMTHHTTPRARFIPWDFDDADNKQIDKDIKIVSGDIKKNTMRFTP